MWDPSLFLEEEIMKAVSERTSKFVELPCGHRVGFDLVYSPNVLTGLPRGSKYDNLDLNSPRLATLTLHVLQGSAVTSISVALAVRQKDFSRKAVRKLAADALLLKLRTNHSDLTEYPDYRVQFDKDDRRWIFQMICPEYGRTVVTAPDEMASPMCAELMASLKSIRPAATCPPRSSDCRQSTFNDKPDLHTLMKDPAVCREMSGVS